MRSRAKIERVMNCAETEKQAVAAANRLPLIPLRVALLLAAACWLLTVAAVAPRSALAWGAQGHRVASEVALQFLGREARGRLHELLGAQSLHEAALWPDRMREDPAPFWQETAPPWHYVTVPPGMRYADVGPPPRGDALSALERFTGILRDPQAGLEDRQLALRFGVHIIQDLHQPLHVGSGRDRGGNDVTVWIDGERSNLHSLWDRAIVAFPGRDIAAWTAALRRRGLLRDPTRSDLRPERWVAESAALRETLYPPPRHAGSSYFRSKLPAVEERLALAGIRTAAWLNAVLAPAAGRPGS
jgi:hypothetical protein